jgi:uncharacterized protein (TIGR03437 family)
MKKTIYAILVIAAPAMAQLTLNPLPSREFGQPTLLNPSPNSASPNLVVGQELYSPSAIAFDTSVPGPPRVYVADTGNNRVLGWSNANAVGQTLGKASMADMVLGQEPAAAGGFDFTATLWWGPQTNNNIGFDTPTGVAVDAAGNVYVADSCNNRILRFATPYKQQPGNLIVDLVIGQKSITSGNYPNQNQSAPSNTSLALAVGSCPGSVLAAGLAIDNQGNLWAADPGNQRVLMFPAANLTANNQLPQATVVLGQFGFTSLQTPTNNSQTNGGLLIYPSSVATDIKGNVYVTDAGGRALVYAAPVSTGETATTILGVPPTATQASPAQSYPNQSSLGAISGTSISAAPQGVFVLNNGPNGVSVLVCDSPQNRVAVYNSLVVPANANSPLISATVGQNGSYTLGQPNQGMLAPTNMTFWNPVAGAIRPDNGEMWIVDQNNNRVVAFASQGGGVYNSASRVLGQTDYIYNGANLLEGRELWLASAQFAGAGIAFDTSSCTLGLNVAACTTPPYLYIADTLNNRVLGFKNGLSVGVNSMNQLAQTADIVIGQADRFHNVIDYAPANTTSSTLVQPTATGLYRPVGLAVDKNGNLWVADSGNGRVVRFPKPFAQAANQPQTADTVLGQNSLTSYNPSASQFLMEQPYGLTLFSNGNLAVSDPSANRVLVFETNGGIFTSGQAASIVIGQSGFNATTSGGGNTQLNSPRHLAVDSSDFLYICDYNNTRLVVYAKPVTNPPGNPAFVSGTSIGQPESIAVSYATGYIWLASGTYVTQYPALNQLSQNPTPNQQFQQFTLANTAGFGPLAVALDPFDNVLVADSANRLSFFYGQLSYRNTASYAAGVGSAAGPSPTMLVILTRDTFPALNQGFQFTPSYTGTDVNLAPPWPPTLNGIQVTVNGVVAPIFRIEPYGVFVEVPNQAPSSGPAEFLVSNPATGQILAAAILNMQAASPGIYTVNSAGTSAVAANNYDVNGNPLPIAQFINSSANPVSAGGIIGLWLTGAGNIPGLPADGTAPNGLFQTPVFPNVLINGVAASVVGSAMSPQYPGLWQVNVTVPAKTPPSSVDGPISVLVQMDSYYSNIGGNPQNFNNGTPGPDTSLTVPDGLVTTIYVK